MKLKIINDNDRYFGYIVVILLSLIIIPLTLILDLFGILNYIVIGILSVIVIFSITKLINSYKNKELLEKARKNNVNEVILYDIEARQKNVKLRFSNSTTNLTTTLKCKKELFARFLNRYEPDANSLVKFKYYELNDNAYMSKLELFRTLKLHRNVFK